MRIELEDYENGQDSGSDSGGSVGTDSGSASGSGASGSNRDVSGNGGDVSGSGGDVSGSAEFGTDSGSNGNDSAEPNGNDVANNVESNSGNSDVARSRADRIRERRTVRLGSAVRDRNTSAADGDASGNDDDETLLEEPVIRLGAKPRGRPRTKVDPDNSTGEIKLSETKDLISMFLSSIFEIPAVTLRQDHWKLTKDENKILTDALMDYIKSMPKARSSKIAQFISEHLPIVNLVMVAFFVMSERVKTSMAIYQITKSGRAFDIGTNEAPKAKANSGIRTPLDEVFS